MPYPLDELAFGIARRLHELAYPSERYKLQIAAPENESLKPIQLLEDHKDIFLKFKFRSDPFLEISFGGPTYFMEKDNLYHTYYTFCFVHLKDMKSFHRAIGYFLLDSEHFVFDKCAVSVELFEEVMKRQEVPVTAVEFGLDTFESDFTVQYLCQKLPHLQGLRFIHDCFFKSDWLETFMAAGYSDLQELMLCGASDQVLDINADDFVKFLKKHPNLQIVIQMKTHVDSHVKERKMDLLFGQHFLIYDDLKNHTRVRLCFDKWYYICLKNDPAAV